MQAQMSVETLRRENRVFAGTGGLSQNNWTEGFVPAFRDSASGVAARARFADGRPAPMHLLDGLPEDWITQRSPCGRVVAVKATVVAGFLRWGRFYTREQAAAALN